MDQGKVIRFSLVALPAGLVLLGAASVFVTHYLGGRDADAVKEAEQQAKAAAILRRPVSREDLARHVSTLAGDIGERHPENYRGLRAAAFWIESTLGPSNMGYAVQRQVHQPPAEEEIWDLVAELPGRGLASEVVVVAARYDSPPGSPGASAWGSGVAAMLSLANAFSGEKPARAIHFVAHAGETPPLPPADGAFQIAALLRLDSLGNYRSEPGSQRAPGGEAGAGLPGEGNFLALAADAASDALAREVEGALRESGAGLPVIRLRLPGGETEGWPGHWRRTRDGVPELVITDTGAWREPRHGQPEDLPEILDYSRLEAVTLGLQAALEKLANP